MLLNLLGQLGTGSLDDPALIEHMDILRTNHLQQTVVMGDDNAGSFRGCQFVHAFSHNTHGVHIQTGIRLVKDAQLRFQHRHLENLIAFLLTATESFIHRTVG